MILASLFLLLWALAGAVVLAMGTRTPRPGTMRLVRSCDRRIALVHSEVTARLWPSAHDLPSGQRDLKNYRVVQILDHSSSMGSGPGSPLEHAISAAVSFAENVMSDRCHMGVVEFDQDARIVHPVSASKSAIVQALRGISSGGATDIALGLRQAWSAIQETGPASPDIERIAVLLSDGGSDAETALQAAKVLKDAGVRVIVIAFGSYVSGDLLRKIASSDDDYFQTLDPANLVRLYEAISASMEAVRGFRAHVKEGVARTTFLLTATGYAQPVSISFNDGTAEWFVPFVTVRAKDIPYQIVPMKPGWHRIGASRATMDMVDRDGLPYRASSNESPYLLVLPRGWWAGLAVIFNPIFWVIWEAIWRSKAPPYHITPAPARLDVPLPDAQPVLPSLRKNSEVKLRPTLLIGIGYSGLLVLRALRYHLARLNPAPQGLQRYLSIDTGLDSQDDGAHSPPFGDALPAADCVLLPENVQPEFQRADAVPRSPHLAWINSERARRTMVPRDYDLSRGTLRRRVLGRAALYQHLESGADSAVSKALDERLLSLGEYYRVIVIGHTGGGTGGGMLSDVLLWTRKRIARLEHEPASVDALLLTHRMLDNSAEPSMLRNTMAFASEFSRLSNRRHLPLAVPQFPGDATEVQGLVDRVLVLEQPLEAPTDKTQWPGPVVHAAAETILALLLESRTGAAVFVDDQASSSQRVERASGHAIVCAASATSRWLPMLEARRLITTRTVLDFVSRDFLRIDLIAGELVPIRDSQSDQLEQDIVRRLLDGGGLARPRPEMLGSLATLADEASSPAELARLVSQMHTYPGSAIPFDIGGDLLFAEVLNREQELCAALLEEWALQVLNGEPRDGVFDPDSRRGGFFRLSAAAARLDALSDACIQNLNAQEQSAIGRGDARQFECIRYLFLRYRVILRGFRRHLDSWSVSLLTLAQQTYSTASAVRSDLQAVLDELSPYALWSPKIEADLVARYGDPVRARLLDQVMWTSQVEPDGATRLAVRVQGCDNKRILGSLDQVLSLRSALEELVPELELSCGLDLYLENASRYADWNGWLRSNRADPVDMDSNLQMALAGRPLVRREWAYIAGEAQEFSDGVVEVVPTGYPYRASIVRVLSNCALFATGAVGDVTRRFPQDAHGDWPFLDPVDGLAATHEDRFAELGLTAPMLCPAMRTYFADRDMLRAFALAHGFKWLAIRLGTHRQALFFKKIQLTSEESLPDYPVLLEALDHFVILGRTGSGAAVDRDNILAQVDDDLAGCDAQAIQDLCRALSGRFDPYLENCPPAVRTDFLNLTRLFFELELRRREESVGVSV